MYKKCDEILKQLEQEGKIKRLDFHFPEKQPLELRLKDLLDNEVDEKGYIPDMYNPYNNSEIKDIAPTQSTQCGSTTSSSTILIRNKSLRETLEQNNIEKDISFIDSYNRNIRKDDLSGTITTRVSDSNNTFIAIKKDKPICLNSKGGRNGIEGLQPSRKDRVYSSDGIAVTIATSDFYNPNYTSGLRIRKLTPKECLKLMGFDDEDYEKIKSIGISRSQIYKQAGNSIVVNVLEAIFKELFKEHITDLDKWSDLD